MFRNFDLVFFSGQASTSEFIEKAPGQGHGWELLPKPIDPERTASQNHLSSYQVARLSVERGLNEAPEECWKVLVSLSNDCPIKLA